MYSLFNLESLKTNTQFTFHITVRKFQPQRWSHTVWKIYDFYIIQILREINFEGISFRPIQRL